MIYTLIIASIFSAWIYTKFVFKNQIGILYSSYKKTLAFENVKDSEPIKESLFQMKIIFILFSKVLIIIIPFTLIVGYIILNKQSLEFVFFNLMNNVIIIGSFIISSLIFKNGK